MLSPGTPALPMYWLNLFSLETWQQFRDAGAEVTGFRANRLALVKTIQPGDVFLCYMTQISRWVGILEATSSGYRDEKPIWTIDVFPARVNVKPILLLSPENGVPIFEVRNELSIFRNLTNPNAWTGHLRGSPARWKREDGEAVVAALREAHAHPVTRDLDRRKLRRGSPLLRAHQSLDYEKAESENPGEITKEDIDLTNTSKTSEHTAVQWRLLKLGSDLGLDVWVAQNDRGRTHEGHDFGALKRLRKRLPRQFDQRTSRTIENIDILWIKNDAIIAAFEIESTTAIYSGLLRMSDLLARQPHLNIPLFIVAPEARRDKVMREIVRPTFESLQTPLRNVCMFISFEDLENLDRDIRKALPSLSALQPEFIQQIAHYASTDEDEE